MKDFPTRFLFVSFLLFWPVLAAFPQKSRVLAVFQMIDQGKYEEAKEDIELAVWNDKTSRWPRTYYAKGLLCQTAWEEGYKSKDPKKTNVYPDQLYVAYAAYERALDLDSRGRLEIQIAQRYYHLSNSFRQLGKDHFNVKEYDKAFRAFEQALLINNSELVDAPVDTNLVFNTAMAAYESEDWGKAIGYLTGLHDAGFTPGTSLLLYQAHLAQGDTTRAEEVLEEALELHKYESQVVVYLVNLLDNEGRSEEALKLLDEAIAHRPENYKFHWSRGLIQRRHGDKELAIISFTTAHHLAPEEPMICFHLGVIYYNNGIDLRNQAIKIRDIHEYRAVENQVKAQFREAVQWLEKAHDLSPGNEEIVEKLHQLYYQLQMKQGEASL
jgi:tetratricopeptide (TPR) repeat protein